MTFIIQSSLEANNWPDVPIHGKTSTVCIVEILNIPVTLA